MELLAHGIRRASTRALVAVLALAATLAAPRGVTASPQEYQFNIEKVSVLVGLRKFARLTNLHLGYDAEPVSGRVGPVKGRYTADAALRALLEPVALTYEWVTPRAVRIYKAAPHSLKTIEEVFVLESRLDGGAGMVTLSRIEGLDRKRIQGLGATTIADVLKRIPQQTFVRAEGFRTDGAQHADLRGLGPDATAILINGRRTAPSATSISLGAFDLMALPLPAVERVEVLPDLLPSRYGADAIGGAVNLILKQDIAVPEITLHYGSARDGGAEHQASVTAGVSRQRAQAALVLDYADRDALLGIDRDRWRDQDYRRFGGHDWRSLVSNPGNVSSIGFTNLPGLASPYVAVPSGSGNAVLTREDLSARAGQRNLTSLRSYQSIVPKGTRASAVASGTVQLADVYSGFGELIWSRRETTAQFVPAALSGHLVPVTNAFNPFDVPVLVSYSFVDIGPRRLVTDTELWRAVAGVRSDGSSRKWEVALLHSQEGGSSRLENEIDQLRVNAALSSSDPQHALNVFHDGPPGSAELLGALIAAPARTDYDSKLTQVSGQVNGRLMRLPAGHIEVGAGVQAHVESVAVRGASSSLPPMAYERETLGLFSDWRLPLLAPSGPGASGALSLSGAARMDSYSEFAHTFNPQFALMWHPHDDITLRASHGTTFRPPSLIELFGPRIEYPVNVPDLRRNGEFVAVLVRSGGNPELLPSTARSLATEVRFTPAAVPGLSMSAKYWRTSVQRRVTSPSVSTLLSREEALAGRAIRAEPTAADIASGNPGRLLALDLSRGNFGRLLMRGVDLQASYRFSTPAGEFTPDVTATRMLDYLAVDLPNDAPVQRVGIANAAGTVTKWRVLASMGWRRKALTAMAVARFSSAYEDTNGSIRIGREVPAQTLVDLQATFDLDAIDPAPAWRGVKLTAGAKNAFDKEPPFSHVNFDQGFDSSQGDLQERVWYVRLSKQL